VTNKIQLIGNTDLDEFKNNLKFTRESKNITITQASMLLNININILQNIENGELDKLTNDVFTIGHIRTYLKWLEMDPNLIISENRNTENRNLNIQKNKVILPYKLKISKFYVSLISIILFFILILIYNNKTTINPNSDVNISTSKIEDNPIKDEIKNLEDEKSPEILKIPEVSLNKEIKIDIPQNILDEIYYIYINATADSWIEIQRNNSEILVSKVIKKGEELKLLYEKDLILVTGNAGGIIIHINDTIISNIGLPGEVKRNISLNYDNLIKFLKK
jgi:cytoskeletal protein RodZ